MLNISICTSVAIYLTVFILLLIRSNHPYILRRSPVLIYISLFGGLIQILVILSIIFLDSKSIIKKYPTNYKWILKLRQSICLLGHILLVVPYLLRSYRLYFIFHLDKNWFNQDNYFLKNIHRTKQRWLLQILFICLLPWGVAVALIFRANQGNYLPGCELKDSSMQLQVSECLYVFISFVEQFSLLISLYSIRNVSDDYKMTKELVWVIILWIITPVYPYFDENGFLHATAIFRDYFLMIRTCILPLISSFKIRPRIELITQEMINSCELILQSETGLFYFEKFLLNLQVIQTEDIDCKIAGAEALDLYMKCEKYLCLPLENEQESLFEELKFFGIDHYEDDSGIFIERVKYDLFTILKTEYFPKFVNSMEYYKLKGNVTKQELFIGRILQTSMHSNFLIRYYYGKRFRSTNGIFYS